MKQITALLFIALLTSCSKDDEGLKYDSYQVPQVACAYKSYIVTLNQTENAPPTESILCNNLGAHEWSYEYDSRYLLSFDFPLNPAKTAIYFQSGVNSMCSPFDCGINIYGDLVLMNDNGGYDGQLIDRTLEIRIYN
jgi:hypothetical protein